MISKENSVKSGSEQILIVDDHDAIRRGVRALLSARAHWSICGEASDGLEAIEQAKRLHPGVILMDISMPKMDGLEATRVIRRELPDCKVIIVTQNDPQVARQQALSSGAHGFIAKAELSRDLLPTLEETMGWGPADAEDASKVPVETPWSLSRNVNIFGSIPENEKGYRSLIEAVDEAFCVIEVEKDAAGKPHDYRFLEANRQFESHTGLASVVGKTARELVPKLNDFWPRLYGRIASTGQAEAFEHAAESDGYHRIFEGYAFRVGAPELRRVAVLFKNITERKRSEEALARASAETDKWKRLYEAVIAYMPDLGYVFDRNHRFTYANKALLEMWGKSWDEAIGRNCLELGYEPWHAAMHDREIEQVIATKQPIRGEVPFNATFGRRIYDYIFFPVFDRNGEVESVGGTTRDITDRKRAEEALEQRSAQYSILLNQAPLGVFLVDAELRVREVNPVAQPVFGNISNLLGQNLREVIGALWDDEYAMEVIGIFRRTLETGQAYHVPERGEYRRDRGTTEFYEWKIDRIPLPDGGFGVVCYFRDISAQVGTRQKILESEERYRRLAERLESEVLARTSELEDRNAEVMQQASALQDMTQSLMRVQDEERRHIARELHDSAGQTLAALGIILGTAKQQSERGDRRVEDAITEALELVRQLTQEIRTASYLLHPPLLDETGLAPALQWYVAGLGERSALEIDLRMAEDFGRLPQGLELAVFRVVQESLTNIVRHSGSKTASIELQINQSTVAMKVEDRGKGMSPEKLALIRANSSGVGIRGMRERVRQLGGELRIESDGKGTTILALLPIPENGNSKEKNGLETLDAAS